MCDPYAHKLNRLRETVLEGPGATEPALRRACAADANVPLSLAAYVDKVARHAYKVTDEDVRLLRQAGYTEDQIFEITVSTAVGAGLERLDAGLRALQGGL